MKFESFKIQNKFDQYYFGKVVRWGIVIPDVPRKSKTSGVSSTIIQHKFAQAT